MKLRYPFYDSMAQNRMYEGGALLCDTLSSNRANLVEVAGAGLSGCFWEPCGMPKILTLLRFQLDQEKYILDPI